MAFKPNKAEKSASLRDTISSFTNDTSLHGIKFVLNDLTSKPRRLLWALVMVGQVSAFIYLVTRQLMFISSRPILTKTMTQYVTNLSFPAVTVCNTGVNFLYPDLPDFDREILDQWAIQNKSYFKGLSEEDLRRTEYTSLFRRMSLMAPDFIIYCHFAAKDCMDSVKGVWSKQNLCFTVNSEIPSSDSLPPRFKPNKTAPRFISYTPGRDEGLQLVMSLGPLGYPPYAIPGVKVILHDPDEKMVIGSSSFIQVAPGTFNFIGVKYHKNKYLPPPFKAFGDKQCQNTENGYRHRLVNVGKYTLRACLEACLVERVVKNCGCQADLEYDNNSCNILQFMECGDNIKAGGDLDNDCSCPIPCEEISYETSLSSTTLGSNGTNRVIVDIFYDRLRVELAEQVEDYTDEDIFASIGGQMGLFLGASLITVVEIMELAVRCGWAWLTGNYTRQQRKVMTSAA